MLPTLGLEEALPGRKIEILQQSMNVIYNITFLVLFITYFFKYICGSNNIIKHRTTILKNEKSEL